MSLKINEQWCSIESDHNENNDHNQNNENIKNNQKIEDRFKEMDQKIMRLEKEMEQKIILLEKEMGQKIILLEKEVKKMESQVHSLSNENLKMVNRVLEAEISLERAKNSLVRKHIPFPFTPFVLSKKFSL
jgi:hypothetical protein